MEKFILKIKEFLNHEVVLGSVIFVSVVFFGLLFRFLLIRFFSLILKKLSKNDKKSVLQSYLRPILKPIGNFAFLLSFNLSNTFFKIPATKYQNYLDRFLSVLIILNVSWFFYAIVSIISLYLERKAAKKDSKLDDQLVPILRKFLKALVFTLAVLFVFQNLGYSISGILAGMGIGGFALAFASKDALSHIFGSIIIFTDKPFQVGDWIVTSGIEGIVEEVGLRSTKIRTFERTLVSVPNNTISNAVVENVSARRQRRISFYLGIKYTTPSHLVKKALEEIKNIIANNPKIDQSYWLVNFRDFGTSSLNIFLYFFSTSPVFSDYVAVQEEVNLQILEALEKIGVQIAVPATTVAIDDKEKN